MESSRIIVSSTNQILNFFEFARFNFIELKTIIFFVLFQKKNAKYVNKWILWRTFSIIIVNQILVSTNEKFFFFVFMCLCAAAEASRYNGLLFFNITGVHGGINYRIFVAGCTRNSVKRVRLWWWLVLKQVVTFQLQNWALSTSPCSLLWKSLDICIRIE